MTKEDLQRELADISTIYVVGIAKGTNPNWDRGIWRTFRLFYIKNNEICWLNFYDAPKDLPNWNPRKKRFESKVLGMDRPFAIVHSFSYWLFGDGEKLKSQFVSY